MLFGLHFQPPELSVWLHGTVQAIMLGGFAALIPKVNAERIREKEEGIDRDEAYAAGVLDDDEDFDEYGYAGGYVCPTCDNTNEVRASTCVRARARFAAASTSLLQLFIEGTYHTTGGRDCFSFTYIARTRRNQGRGQMQNTRSYTHTAADFSSLRCSAKSRCICTAQRAGEVRVVPTALPPV